MPTVITMLNQKGGVGKSTATHNLAAELCVRGQRVLCVDTDQQGTLTLLSGVDRDALSPEQTTLHALLPEKFPSSTPLGVAANWGGDLWPANDDIVFAESELRRPDIIGANQRMRAALAQRAGDYDLVFLDSPPALGVLSINNLSASDYVLIPVTGYTALDGLSKLMRTIEQVRAYENPQLKVLGAFNTAAKPTKHARETAEVVEENFPGAWLQTTIPCLTELENSQPHSVPVRQFAPGGKVAVAYSALAGELLARLHEQSAAAPSTLPEAA